MVSRATVFFIFLGILLPSCATLSIPNVDFAWPVESVQTVDNGNRIEEVRYGLSLNAAPLAMEEFKDSSALAGTQLHILRNHEGYYFVTGRNFMSVYVFASSSGALTLTNKLEISKEGLKNPALNQRPPYVEIVDGPSLTRLLTGDAIIERQAQ